MSFNDGFSTKGIATPPVAPASGNVLVYDGTNWVAGTASGGGGGGDITDVNAGTNLTGGGSSGSVTLSLDTNVTGLTNLQTTNLTASAAFIQGNLVVNGTASIALLSTISQSSLKVGDKFITVMSGGTEHVGLDGAGILWGSGGVGPTIDDQGANAHVRYVNAYDKLQIFPGLYVSGALTASAEMSGTTANFNSVTASFKGDLVGSSSFATSASFATNSTSSSFATNSTSASFANSSTSASFATNSTSASFATNSTSASFANSSTSASFANSSTSASFATNSTSASFAANSTSASFATTAATASYVATGSAIATFTNDVRAQFSAGPNITINNGVISGSAVVTASSNVYAREWHVSTGSGNDITGNGTLLSPYRTVGAAISAASTQGGDQIVLHPGTFIEDVTMSKFNTTICAAQGSNGGEVNFSGTMTISQSIAPGSSIRLFGIAVNNLVHSGTGSLYIEDCKVNNTFTKATTAYFQATNTDFNKDILIISGGLASFQGGNQSTSGSSFIINNPNAFVTIRDSITTYSPVVISGTLGINDCAVVATSSGGPAVTSISPSSVVVMVDSTTLDTNQLATKVTIGGLFSYSNSVFNKTASTLGTNIPSIADFDIVRANTVTATTVTGSTVTGSTALFTTITGSNISYTAATPGNWSGSAPTTVKSAIDRLAARLFAISGAIP